MRVLFRSGVVKEVISAEVKPMDLGNGTIAGTQIDFILANGDKNTYVYSERVGIEVAGMLAVEFVKNLYLNGFADFSDEDAELM